MVADYRFGADNRQAGAMPLRVVKRRDIRGQIVPHTLMKIARAHLIDRSANGLEPFADDRDVANWFAGFNGGHRCKTKHNARRPG